jgi:hypothetical protein
VSINTENGSAYEIGGFAGSSSRVDFYDSYSTGNVDVESFDYVEYVGGFAGNIYHSQNNERLSASGDVSAVSVDSYVSAIGGFAGNMDSVYIYESYATGDVSTEGSHVGGFVGETYDDYYDVRIYDSYATGDVSGNDEVGGFVGDNNYGRIYRSYATGDVSGSGEESTDIGGFVGENDNDSLIEQSYATGNVTGDMRVGGFVGENDEESSKIRDSYATGNVTGISRVGGFAGYNDSGLLINVYSVGLVSGVENVGGLVGDTGEGSSAENSFWNLQTSGQNESAQGESLTSSQMRNISNYPVSDSENQPFSLGSVSGVQAFRYLVWEIIDTKYPEEGGVQASEFSLYLNGEKLEWPGETNISNPSGNNYLDFNEGPGSLMDDDLETKWLDYDFELNGYVSTIIIDMGEEVSFDGYSWATGNDVSDRDPVSWVLYGADEITDISDPETIVGELIELDAREEETITSEREVYVHLNYDGWDFDEVWNIQNNKNNGYPFLRWSTLENTPIVVEDTPVIQTRRSSGGMASSAMLAKLGIKVEKNDLENNKNNDQDGCEDGFMFGPKTGARCAKPTQENNNTENTPKENTCPADQILTQNLRSGSRNGRFNTYTGGIVTQANILQAHLNRLGFNSGPVDGILGRLSDGAIRRMQTFLGTRADGFVGPITRGLINNSCGSEGLQN